MYCARLSMSSSDNVPATLVMLPASLVRRFALKSASCFFTYSYFCPATRGISFWPGELAEVTHRAQHLVRFLLAERDLGRRRP